MSYATESRSPLFGGMGSNNVTDPYLTANLSAYVPVLQPCIIQGVGVYIHTTLTANGTLTVSRRVTPNSATNNVTLANMSLAPYANMAAGKIAYCGNNFVPQSANAGDELVFTVANGGSLKWAPWIEAVARAETKLNNNDFVAMNNATL